MARTILKIILPKTPSLNNLYGTNRNGRKYIKNHARVWKEECILRIRVLTTQETFLGKCSLLVHLYTSRHQDNDSILKLLMDSIQASEIIKDDYQIFDERVIKHKCKKDDERVDILLKEML